uniref:Putative ovule protein n=1 Tax=Solanum chacoense TaxID=4108 RepID=A0A0V0GIN5_SOLCH
MALPTKVSPYPELAPETSDLGWSTTIHVGEYKTSCYKSITRTKHQNKYSRNSTIVMTLLL